MSRNGAARHGRRPIRTPPLLERGAELDAVDRALDAALGGIGSLTIVEGEPGIGKSSIIGVAAERAAARDLRVLRARGGEFEGQFPYGVIVELFGAALRSDDDRRRLLRGAARAAEPVFGASPASAGEAMADPLTSLHGLYWLTIALADAHPILIAADDVHWADEASIRFFDFLAKRISDLPIALFIGLRPPAADERPSLRALRTNDEAVHVAPKRLSETGVGELVARNHIDDPAGSITHACWEATRGNPFYVNELLHDPEVATSLVTGGGLPDRLTRSLHRRIARQNDDARRAAEAIAILGDEANLRRVGALANLDDETTVTAVRSLVDASIIEHEGSLAFVHPIVREAVSSSIAGVARARAHRKAADVLHADGAPIEAVGAQLLDSERGGDPRVVSMLQDAGLVAARRGDLSVAIACLERALEEPPPEALRPDVLARLARLEAAAGIPTAAARYRAAIALLDEPAARATLLHELGLTEIASARWGDAAATFHEGLEVVGDRDHALSSQLEASFVSSGWITMERHAEAAERLARILQSTELDPAQRDLVAWAAFQRTADLSATADEVLALVDRAMDEPIEDLVRSPQRVEVLAGALVATDELPREIAFLTEALDAVRRTGAFAKYGMYVYCRSWPLYFIGRLTDAIADAQAAVRAADLGWETFSPAASTVLSWACLERGDLEAAEQAIDFDPAPWGQRVDLMILVPIARARIALARGDADAALAQLARARAGAAAIGMRMSAPPDWRSWTVVAMARLGQRIEAMELAEEGVELGRRWGARWPLGVALRAAGLAEGGKVGLRRLEESVTLLAESPARLEHARSLVDLGAAARRAGSAKAAREHLTVGMGMAHGLGAYALAAEARAELVAAGARPRRLAVSGTQALTPSELRVAQMVAEGRTNREVAQGLFVTPKAVEYHLANAYRKLHIGSRAELRGALGADAMTEASTSG